MTTTPATCSSGQSAAAPFNLLGLPLELIIQVIDEHIGSTRALFDSALGVRVVGISSHDDKQAIQNFDGTLAAEKSLQNLAQTNHLPRNLVKDRAQELSELISRTH